MFMSQRYFKSIFSDVQKKIKESDSSNLSSLDREGSKNSEAYYQPLSDKKATNLKGAAKVVFHMHVELMYVPVYARLCPVETDLSLITFLPFFIVKYEERKYSGTKTYRSGID